MAFTPKLKCPVYFKLGSKTCTEYIEVKKAADALGLDKCACLLSLHSFTGCDTMSSFAGRGKVSALGLLSHEEHMATLQSLGQSWNLSIESIQQLEKLTYSLYSPKTAINSVNVLRFNIFCAKKAKPQSWQSSLAHLPCSITVRGPATNVQSGREVWTGIQIFLLQLAMDGG